MEEKTLSEELKCCMETKYWHCGKCEYRKPETTLICKGLLQKVYERIKKYEEMFPCNIGDTVYTNYSMQGWYFKKENRPYEAKLNKTLTVIP